MTTHPSWGRLAPDYHRWPIRDVVVHRDVAVEQAPWGVAQERKGDDAAKVFALWPLMLYEDDWGNVAVD